VKRRSPFHYRSSFFGLTQEYRFNIFKQIHEIVFHGRGGYNYETIYDMPVWLRNITHRFISESINQENEAQQKAYSSASNSKGKSTATTNIDLNNPSQGIKK
jgi:hypothetical protein